jgi:hypothetical protein
MEPNPERRELTFHTEIRIRNHAEHQRWCLDCHDADDRDRLRLINGDTVDFKNSYFLCGQCHGGIFKDWKIGVHGKRTGYWDGPKKYMPCTYCHNPHSPRFRPIKPIAPPMRPDETLVPHAKDEGELQDTEYWMCSDIHWYMD